MLLEVPEVEDKAHLDDNIALRISAKRGYTDLVESLATIPKVRDFVASENTAFLLAAEYGHCEAAYILASVRWPSSKADMPKELHSYIPMIRKGEIIHVNGKQEAAQLLRYIWWKNNVPISTRELYSLS